MFCFVLEETPSSFSRIPRPFHGPTSVYSKDLGFLHSHEMLVGATIFILPIVIVVPWELIVVSICLSLNGYWCWIFFHVLICHSLCWNVSSGPLLTSSLDSLYFYCLVLRVSCRVYIVVSYWICGLQIIFSVCNLSSHPVNKALYRIEVLIFDKV